MFNRIDKNDTLQFFKRIVRYFSATNNLHDAVSEYVRMTEPGPMRDIGKDVYNRLSNGASFSEALERHPQAFPAFIVAFIRLGETTGHLVDLMQEIIKTIKQDMAIEKKISSATFMPKISLVILLGVLGFGVYYLIPRISTSLASLNIELPLLTRMTVKFGEVASDFWWVFPLLIGLAFAGFRYYKQSNPVKYSLLSLRIPLYKDIAYYRMHYHFCKMFALCVRAGIAAGDALHYVALSSTNLYFAKILEKASDLVMNAGVPIDEAIKRSDYEHILHPEVITMLVTGVVSGKLAEVMEDEAGVYEDELNNAMEGIGDKISVAVLVPSYGFMIFIFAVMEYPLINLTNSFGKMGSGM